MIGGKSPDDAGFTKTYMGEAMSQQDERDGVSRRRVLQAAASIVPLHFGSHVATALAHFGMAGATQQLGDDLLARKMDFLLWTGARRLPNHDYALPRRQGAYATPDGSGH
jgi:hypothetical protein